MAKYLDNTNLGYLLNKIKSAFFRKTESVEVSTIEISDFEASANKVSTIASNETNTTKYPNTKAVYDFVKALADANNLTMP